MRMRSFTEIFDVWSNFQVIIGNANRVKIGGIEAAGVRSYHARQEGGPKRKIALSLS